jgi:hypothetical protein
MPVQAVMAPSFIQLPAQGKFDTPLWTPAIQTGFISTGLSCFRGDFTIFKGKGIGPGGLGLIASLHIPANIAITFTSCLDTVDCNPFEQRESDGSFSATDFAKGKAKTMEFIFAFLCLGNQSVLPIM